MARFHQTSEGLIEFTALEEAARDTAEAAWSAGADDRVAVEVRAERDALIKATDFYALSDVVMTTEMTAYRQALRTLPEQEGFPNTVTFPTAP